MFSEQLSNPLGKQLLVLGLWGCKVWGFAFAGQIESFALEQGTAHWRLHRSLSIHKCVLREVSRLDGPLKFPACHIGSHPQCATTSDGAALRRELEEPYGLTLF